MATLAPKSYPMPNFDNYKAGDDYKKMLGEQDRIFAELQENASKVNINKGEVVGLIHHIPWADGAAYYLVTKAKPLTLQHIPIGDAWEVPYTYIRGIRKDDILEQARTNQRIEEMMKREQ